MTLANPPPIARLPKAWQSDPDIRSAMETRDQILFQLWTRSGGGSDTITNITSSESFETSVVGAEFHDRANDNSQLEDLAITPEDRSFNALVKATAYTAVDHDWVEARRGVIIKLDDNAQHNDEIIVANGDGTTITVDAQSLRIKYTSLEQKIELRKSGTSFHFQLFVHGAEKYWRVR